MWSVIATECHSEPSQFPGSMQLHQVEDGWLKARGSLFIRPVIREGFPASTNGKEPVSQCRRQKMQVRSLGWEDPLEEGLATHSSVLAWRIPMTDEPGSLWYRGSYMNHYRDKLEGEMPLTFQEA